MAAGVCVLMALAVSRVLRSMLVGPGAPPPEHQLESANRWLSCSFALQKTVILGARNPGVAAGSSGGAGGVSGTTRTTRAATRGADCSRCRRR